MPKKYKDFPVNLNFNCSEELKQILVALSYMRGSRGSYAAVARDMLLDGVNATIANMELGRRTDFEEILENVKVRSVIQEIKKPPA